MVKWDKPVINTRDKLHEKNPKKTTDLIGCTNVEKGVVIYPLKRRHFPKPNKKDIEDIKNDRR